MKKKIAKMLHNLAYCFYTQSYEELENEFHRLSGGKKENWCEICNCYCSCHPCRHTKVKINSIK